MLSILLHAVAGIIIGIIGGIIWSAYDDYQIHKRVVEEDKRSLHFMILKDNGEIDRMSVSNNFPEVVDGLLKNGWVQYEKYPKQR